jgi:hypothetical protein
MKVKIIALGPNKHRSKAQSMEVFNQIPVLEFQLLFYCKGKLTWLCHSIFSEHLDFATMGHLRQHLLPKD